MPEEDVQETEEAPEAEEAPETEEAPEAEAKEDDAKALDSRLVVEGMLFSADKPLRIADIEDATALERGAVRSAIRKLASDYRRRNTALEVVKVDNRWTMQVRSEYTPVVRSVAAPEVDPRLLRTLALIAYHQPILQSDLQEMLGPKVYEHVRELKALGLISARPKGASKELTTTQKFPEYFGLDSAKKEDIKKFMADRVGIEPEMPQEVGETAPEIEEAVPQQEEAIPQKDEAVPQQDEAIPQQDEAVPQQEEDEAVPEPESEAAPAEPEGEQR